MAVVTAELIRTLRQQLSNAFRSANCMDQRNKNFFAAELRFTMEFDKRTNIL